MDSRSHGIEWLWALAAITACALILFMSGCAKMIPHACVSHCGMLVEVDAGNGSMNCDHLDEAEKAFVDNADERFCASDKRMCKKSVCDSSFGWQIKAGSETRMYIPEGLALDGGFSDLIPAVGYSDCGSKTMWLGDNKDWRAGSYVHEMFHVAQGCQSGWIGPERSLGLGDGHGGWYDAGIYDFINDFREGRR